MASYPIADIHAIAPFYAAKLKSAGIRSTTKLLERAATPKLRKELAAQTNIPMNLILDWANIADLTRISGIAIDYAELLVAAGVDTVRDLRRRNPKNLAIRLAEVNGKKQLVELLPSEKRIKGWVVAAQGLTPAMNY